MALVSVGLPLLHGGRCNVADLSPKQLRILKVLRSVNVRDESESGWPSCLDTLWQRISAYTRLDRVRGWKVGISAYPERRAGEHDLADAGYDEMVLIYKTRSIENARLVEDLDHGGLLWVSRQRTPWRWWPAGGSRCALCLPPSPALNSTPVSRYSLVVRVRGGRGCDSPCVALPNPALHLPRPSVRFRVAHLFVVQAVAPRHQRLPSCA